MENYQCRWYHTLPVAYLDPTGYSLLGSRPWSLPLVIGGDGKTFQWPFGARADRQPRTFRRYGVTIISPGHGASPTCHMVPFSGLTRVLIARAHCTGQTDWSTSDG